MGGVSFIVTLYVAYQHAYITLHVSAYDMLTPTRQRCL